MAAKRMAAGSGETGVEGDGFLHLRTRVPDNDAILEGVIASSLAIVFRVRPIDLALDYVSPT